VRHRTDEAYVLATQELGEADAIVTLLAEHTGLVRGVAPSARKSRKRFGGTLEPLTRVRATWNEKPGRELYRIEDLELVRSYAPMQAEPARQAACAVLAEIFRAVAREDQPEPQGFRPPGSGAGRPRGGLDPFVAVRYAEYWTLRLHGVLSDPSACADCGAPLDETGWASPVSGVLCPDCLKSRSVGARRLQPAIAPSCGRRPARPRPPCRHTPPRRDREVRWRRCSRRGGGLRGAHAAHVPPPPRAQRPAGRRALSPVAR
jgi:DNA repair protein RecO (recombination protein O)